MALQSAHFDLTLLLFESLKHNHLHDLILLFQTYHRLSWYVRQLHALQNIRPYLVQWSSNFLLWGRTISRGLCWKCKQLIRYSKCFSPFILTNPSVWMTFLPEPADGILFTLPEDGNVGKKSSHDRPQSPFDRQEQRNVNEK